ncbi:NADH-ubiquinone reductase (H(+)-translocating) NDE2 [Sugiyamaella lignohabitans]|uniref:NADH-ubiquinone reductase (H(+)-translocating) NDE2 n=1 Tax=Sugiyamaella lignohabitans TaxID=796027 RepID=A0A161HN71_9ASCO|nr:NADH-ubiquinone reductase (H(+)-translocating) NDE2 [Sugiyamaella lignohabitans]ANB15517.1 NADH-ubiquinone reductase (H(+)-translocating) NDE2 [Sugiyamaella lignohabitans]
MFRIIIRNAARRGSAKPSHVKFPGVIYSGVSNSGVKGRSLSTPAAASTRVSAPPVRKSTTTARENKKSKKNLVVLGSGWGAVSLVRSINPSQYNVTIISPRNFFLFTPLLPSATTGTVEYNSITESISGILAKESSKSLAEDSYSRYLEARATKIDYTNKSVAIEDITTHEEHSVPFDYLVIAAGATTSTLNVPGVKEHGLFLKEIDDSRKIRARVANWINSGKGTSLQAVVVGGGPTGVEVAAELQDLFEEDIKKRIPDAGPDTFKVSLIEAMPSILNSFDKRLRKFATLQLQKDHINLLTNTAVEKITDKTVYAKAKTVLPDKSESVEAIEIPYNMLIWATGITTHQFIREFMSTIPEQKDSKRGVLINDDMSVKGVADVWAIGDCTSSKYPATAQVATQQGTYLGTTLNQLATVTEAPDSTTTSTSIAPFEYHHKGSLAYVGGNRAVADLQLWSDGKMSSMGYFTYWMWRVAYLSMFVPAQNRFLVAADWLRVKLFGRNINTI